MGDSVSGYTLVLHKDADPTTGGVAIINPVGVGPWDYIWFNLESGEIIQTNNNVALPGVVTVSGLNPGDYLIQVQDLGFDGGCASGEEFAILPPEAISVDFENEININDVINVFKNAEGIRLIEDGLNEKYPTPEFVEGKNDVYIGRIRKDSSNKKGLNFWIVSDNLRKGAALNAIQIMYSAIKLKKIPSSFAYSFAMFVFVFLGYMQESRISSAGPLSLQQPSWIVLSPTISQLRYLAIPCMLYAV